MFLRAAVALLFVALGCFARDTFETVGPKPGAEQVTPVNQIVDPAGRQVYLPGLRPQGIALSPNGKILITSGKSSELIVIDPAAARIIQTVPFPSDARVLTNQAATEHILSKEDDSQLSFTGLIFSGDGSRIYLSNVGGSVKVFSVDADHRVQPLYSIPLPPADAPRRKEEVPAGLALSKDGRHLYVALNLGNRLAEVDLATSQVTRTWDVGVAPYNVVVAGSKVYVSNWGGRPPDADSVTGPAGRGTLVRVDPVRYIASEGSVSVIDTTSGKVADEILTGKHCCALALSPDGRHLVAANAGADTLSVIDTTSDTVVETISARQDPGDLFGASPNALVFDPSGKRLFVCNGTQNAVAFISFKPGESRLLGLAPVGWFPGAIAWDARRHELYVANIKGMGRGRPRKGNGKPEFNSHQYYGGITLLPEPSHKELAALTAHALACIRYPLLHQASLPPRPGLAPVPVPERVGEPSVFKHILYLIKENRTYDQVLGDVTKGNGDPELCIFGQRVTPNEHKLVNDFVLLDNTYCCGICSADGHEWATTGFATDYMEKLFAGFPRSYPDGCEDADEDALAYSPAGFIWDDFLEHGKTVRDYGEFASTRKAWRDKSRHGAIKFLDDYHDFIGGGGAIAMHSDPGVESLRKHIDSAYIGWDLDVPDVQRAAQFIEDYTNLEAHGGLPNLMIFSLPNDHTSGTRPGSPTPAAQVADNDRALGEIVDFVSHSRDWADTCIFAIEDDPQSGWDHVSGYRTTVYLVSPYCKRGSVVNVQYNQTSLLRTMELMLGLPPMNQMDATATPLTVCFTNVPDLAPYVAVTNNIPIDQMNPGTRALSDAALRNDSYVSARLPLQKPDQCPDDVLNHILWRAMKGSTAPYPDWAVPSHMNDD